MNDAISLEQPKPGTIKPDPVWVRLFYLRLRGFRVFGLVG